MTKTLLIFDMDGVLVEPMRYRAALEGTMDYFGNLMGWESLYPGEETIAWFESRGIISEWDITPIFLAATFESILAAHPILLLPADLISACKLVKDSKIPKPEIKIEPFINHLLEEKASGATYCDQVLQTNPSSAIFHSLAETPLLSTILSESRNLHTNLVTRLFQEIYLGNETFTSTFNLPVIIGSNSVCQIIDKELISPEWKQKLIQQFQSEKINMVIYTARPSFPNIPSLDGQLHYSPEADIIADQLGWQKVPLIGQGQLRYVADQIGCTPDDLIKPSPAHALGAIGTVLNDQYLPAVQAGWNLVNKSESTFFDTLPELEIHIFEDSPTGIFGVTQAVEILRKRGASIKLTKWGIASDKNKMEQLLLLGSRIHPSVNEALESIPFLNETIH